MSPGAHPSVHLSVRPSRRCSWSWLGKRPSRTWILVPALRNRSPGWLDTSGVLLSTMLGVSGGMHLLARFKGELAHTTVPPPGGATWGIPLDAWPALSCPSPQFLGPGSSDPIFLGLCLSPALVAQGAQSTWKDLFPWRLAGGLAASCVADFIYYPGISWFETSVGSLIRPSPRHAFLGAPLCAGSMAAIFVWRGWRSAIFVLTGRRVCQPHLFAASPTSLILRRSEKSYFLLLVP